MALDFYPLMLTSWAAAAIVYAADNGADVINMSWGLPSAVGIWRDALEYASDKGVILVASAGNDGEEKINFPAGFDKTIAVSASDADDEVTYWSTYGSNISVTAPGDNILSLRAADTDMYGNNGSPAEHIIEGKYYLASGTSMSGPHVVGVAAYLRSVSAGITHDKAKEIIEQTADDLTDPNGDDQNFPGWDKFSGYGRVNLNNAIAAAPGVRAKITSPLPNQLISRAFNVEGTADGAEFKDFVLEIGEGSTPTDWTELAISSIPITEGELWRCETEKLTGQYTIRLRVGQHNISAVSVYIVDEPLVEIIAPQQGDTAVSFVDVYGTAICPDFKRLTLEYGQGAAPVVWPQIHESTAPAFNTKLTSWSASNLPGGNYILRLSAYSSDGIVASNSLTLHLKSLFTPDNGWRIALDGDVTFVPTYGDIDGDGANEIIVGTSRGIKFFNTDGTPKTNGVPSVPDYSFLIPVAIGDLDNDGYDDFVAASNSPARLLGFVSGKERRQKKPPQGQINVLSLPVGTQKITRPDISLSLATAKKAFDRPLLSYPQIKYYSETSTQRKYPRIWLKDINNDGKDEIHYLTGGESAGRYYIFKPSGSLWAHNDSIPKNVYCAQAADLDGDRLCEIYCATSNNEIVQIDISGRKTDDYAFGKRLRPVDMSAVDINGDGKLELVFMTAFHGFEFTDYFVYVFDENLRKVSGWPRSTGVTGFVHLTPPVFGDVNGDGMLEYFTSYWHPLVGSYMHGWSVDGTPVKGGDHGDGTFAVPQEMSYLHGTILADIDGDAAAEIVVAQNCIYFSPNRNLSLVAWDSRGESVQGWPLITDANVDPWPYFSRTPVIGDANQDGLIDIFMTTFNNEIVFTNFPDCPYYSSGSPSPFWRYNRRMNNIAPVARVQMLAVSQTDPVLLPQLSVEQNYPNPFNPETVIEFSLRRDSEVEFRVYNILGQTVNYIDFDNLSTGKHSIRFNGRDDSGSELPSGVYFYQIKADEMTETKKMVLLK